MTLARLVGSLELAALRRGLRYYELSTREIDRSLGLDYTRGNRKKATRRFAELNGYGEMDEHQCDAYCVGRAALGIMKVEDWKRQAKGSVA